jgi:hypothetical protein
MEGFDTMSMQNSAKDYVYKVLNTGVWVTFGFDHTHQAAQDLVDSGTAEKRWNEEANRIEYRRL